MNASSTTAASSTGVEWRAVADTVSVTGPPDGAALRRCRELGATVAATLM